MNQTDFFSAKSSKELRLMWSGLRKTRAQALADGDFRKKGFIDKQLATLKPYLQGVTPHAHHSHTTEPLESDTTKRFSFYLSATPSSHLDQVCHAVFAQWLTYRGFKRQTSAEKLADYRQMITCIVCNLAMAPQVRLSRDKADYARAVSHYRPSVFNKRFLTVLDDLHSMGVLIQTKGQRYKHNVAHDFDATKRKYQTQGSILTRLAAGPTLAGQLKVTQKEEVVMETATQEVVMLKRDAGSELVEYEETPRTLRYRQQMKLVNQYLERAGALLTQDGADRFDDRTRFLVRKFTYNNFEKGGRLWGGLWDSPMTKGERSELLRIQGCRTIELDFDSVNIHLAYALHGEEPPLQADMYAIPGLHPESRPGVKKFINAHFFKESTRKQFPKDRTSGRSVIEDFHMTDQCKSYAQILALIEAVHPALVRDLFGTGVGHHLQFLESQLMVNILLRCSKKGVVCLPLHDALVVREDQGDRVTTIMEWTAKMVLGRVIPVSKKGGEELKLAS